MLVRDVCVWTSSAHILLREEREPGETVCVHTTVRGQTKHSQVLTHSTSDLAMTEG